MVMKGSARPNPILVNNYELLIEGLPPLLFTEVKGAEQETEKTEMPDRTVESGGNVKPSEVTVKMLSHHTVEVAAMDTWRKGAIDPVSPTYKKTGTLIKRTQQGSIGETKSWTGVWITKDKDADLEMKNAGDPAQVEYTLSIDKINRI